MTNLPGDFLSVLNSRSQDIFKKIVERYLDTGEPVGSRDLSRMLAVGLSPASADYAVGFTVSRRFIR